MPGKERMRISNITLRDLIVRNKTRRIFSCARHFERHVMSVLTHQSCQWHQRNVSFLCVMMEFLKRKDSLKPEFLDPGTLFVFHHMNSGMTTESLFIPQISIVMSKSESLRHYLSRLKKDPSFHQEMQPLSPCSTVPGQVGAKVVVR